MNRIIAMVLAVGLIVMGVFFINPGVAIASVAGDSPQNPVVLASPSDVPEGAVEDHPSTYNTPSECDTTRSWVLTEPGQHHDAVTHVVHHPAVTHEETVIDSAAVWMNFSPNDQQETFIGPPAAPTLNQDGTWNVNTDPRGTWHDHGQLPPGQAGPDGVYANGNPDKGGNWFFRQAQKSHVETVVDHDAYDETVVDHEAYDDPDVITYYAWSDGAQCPVVIPDVATATVVTTPPTCSEDGTASIVTVNSHVISDTIVGTPGEHEAVVEADTGAVFEQGPGVSDDGKFMTISYTVPAATGDCPKPPSDNPPGDHNNPVPPKHNVPPATFKALPNAGIEDNSTNYLPYGVAGLLIASGALLLRRRRA